MGRKLRVIAVACVLASASGVASAELFKVTFANGVATETRYRPILSDDETTVYMLTDMGNWISMDRDHVVDVVSEIEAKGYGLRIDTTTISLGIAPNDRAAGEDAAGEISDTQALLNYFQAQDAARDNYSVQQFVDTEEASGIPVGLANQTTPNLGGVDN